MNFLSPWFLLAGLAVSVPILLHLFRRKTDVIVDFPAMRLLHHAPVEQQRRRRLRELILLVLRVGALALLAGSFARPYMVGAAGTADSAITVIAVDTSMSVSAPASLARARELAIAALGEAPSADVVALVAFGDSATVVSGPTTDRSGVQAAIGALVATTSGTRYRNALARVAQVIGSRPARVVMITDVQQSGWEGGEGGDLPDDVPVEVRVVPPPPGNLAVTTIERRAGALVALVHNYGTAVVTAPVALRVDGTVVSTVQATVAPGAAATVTFERALPATGAAEVMVDDPTGYAGDNSRFVALDAAAAVPVTVVVADPAGARGGIYMERALAVAQGAQALAVDVVDGRVMSSWPAEQLTTRAALVILGTRTLDRGGRERIARYLRDGGQVLLTLGPDIDIGTLRDVTGVALDVVPDVVVAPRGTTLVVADGRHPIFRPFLNPSGALGDVAVERFRRLQDEEGRVVLARFSGGATALAEQQVGRGRLLIFTSDLDNQWTRFPLNPAFVPFAVETAQYLTSSRRLRQAWVLPDVPDGQAATPGVFTVGEGAAARRVAVNVNVRESNPVAMTAAAFVASVPRAAVARTVSGQVEARGVEDRQRLWQIGLLVMLVALAGEGLIGRKAL